VSLQFYNTLTRSVEPFEPADSSSVLLYTCGPTVYDYAHIGNFRAYMFEDLLRRHLEYRGFNVQHVMNLTDVDDKTIRASAEEGMALNDYTRKYKDAFFEDVGLLNILPAHQYPAATDHVPEMVVLIERLFEKGLAYKSDDGSVYFSIQKVPGYGKLAHLDLEGLKPGARVDQDEYEKDHVGDFALWKAWVPGDGEVGWESPWGKGRPGWHIECSAMSMKCLGESFDIHCGGVDNIFPHHEDEIAQSEGATGKPFARYWIHCAYLIVDGKKMSKSLGNFYTLRDLVEREYSGREARFVLMTSAHYRQTLNFSLDGLDAARSALARLDEFSGRLRECGGEGNAAHALPGWAADARAQFGAALDDDLNISNAMGALFNLVRAGNRALAEAQLPAEQARAVRSLLNEFDGVLGFLEPETEEADANVWALVTARRAAREARNWAESDRLRDELSTLGWVVQDTAQGPKLKRL